MRNLFITPNAEPRANSLLERHYAAGSINQAALNASTDTKSTTAVHSLQTHAGGGYGFWPELDQTVAVVRNMVAPIMPNDAEDTYDIRTTDLTSGPAAFVTLGENQSGTISARFTYITSSPPYNDGPLFIFAMIDNGTGEIESMCIAPDPPWGNNGPTSIKPDFYQGNKGYKRVKKAKKEKGELILPIEYDIKDVEITMDYKDSDMDLIPHPFIAMDMTGKTVVIIEPGSDMCCQLHELHETGETINTLFHDRKLLIDNTPLEMKAPLGTMPVIAKWKLTK